MDNLWILSEERPKASVIKQIVETYCNDFNDEVIECGEIKIKPLISNGIFDFTYIVENLKLKNIGDIYIKISTGTSSFIDFLVFKQLDAPEENSKIEPIMAIEETKTGDDESRNTAIYQRASKFVYITAFYSNTELYMLYNNEHNYKSTKKPSDTNIFGTNMLLTLGVNFIGKKMDSCFHKFTTLDELIQFKAGMRKPPNGNVPIIITEFSDHIEISARLSKPADKGNIGHDPNIGAVSIISACMRRLGWEKDIVITKHGVQQTYIDTLRRENKLLRICEMLNVKLDGIDVSKLPSFTGQYWKYERKSEKGADILLHLQAIYYGLYCVYENHAGCERGYFRDKKGNTIALPKKDKTGKDLSIPDIVLYDNSTDSIVLIEGKQVKTIQNGLDDIKDKGKKNYGIIEREYIQKYYPGAFICRKLSIFGGNLSALPYDEIMFYLSSSGRIIINKNAPDFIKKCFDGTGAAII